MSIARAHMMRCMAAHKRVVRKVGGFRRSRRIECILDGGENLEGVGFKDVLLQGRRSEER